MKDSDTNTLKRSDDASTTDQACPSCGGPIQAFTRTGPGDVYVSPCGCNVNDQLATRDAAQPAADGAGTELFYAADSGPSGSNRTLHLDEDCRYLANSTVHTCNIHRPPRGELCQTCAPDLTISDIQNDHTPAADGGVDRTVWAHLTSFQRDILKVIAELEDSSGEVYGLAIKDTLERDYGEVINHGRLYPNLNELANKDLVEKGELDKRTNRYTLTSKGRALLLQSLLEDQSLVETLGGQPTTGPTDTAVSGGDD